MVDLNILDDLYALYDYYIEVGEFEKATEYEVRIIELQEFFRNLGK